MSAHTPGPWNWVQYGDGRTLPRLVDFYGNEVLWIGYRASYDQSAGFEPDEADARLIAAAPELLAVLVQAVARQGFTNDELITARATIAKATGGQSAFPSMADELSRLKVQNRGLESALRQSQQRQLQANEQLQQVIHQRNELLAALQAAREFLPKATSMPNVQTRLGDVVLAVDLVIAMATGQPQEKPQE